jgi:hydroxylaminobenzene mutase
MSEVPVGERIARWWVAAGMLLFLGGLMIGFVGPAAVNPRAALGGHVATLMSGVFMIAVGAATVRPGIARWAALAAFVPQVYGAVAVGAGFTLAALWGASRILPIAGAGHHATHDHEALVGLLISTGSLASLLVIALLIAGVMLPGRAARTD